MDVKMIFSAKIEPIELYNFVYIKFKSDGGFVLNNLIQDFLPYISHTFRVTSPSPSVSDKVVHFELTIQTSKLLMSMRPFIWYTYCG